MDSELALEISDPGQLRALAGWLEATRGVTATRTPTASAPNEQGALDILTVVGSSQVLIMAIKTLPAFLSSRRSNFAINATVHGRDIELTASNVADGAVIERIIELLRRDKADG
ncbi:hypothetical protein ACFXHA_04395 [Nocardia sp. NPDC059240]|uniref:effector-associated constant component EACC1 n=1 Tax=Nocardia sp. NPDC059240 TaxID=3346786 RepID=UPI0036BBB931